jgi:two-component system, LuxR family, response regulator FixJ
MPEPQAVYVIDDDEAVRDSLALLLESQWFTMRGFASGLEFLSVASSLAAGCIVMDMRMPGMDGLELLERLKERKLSLPVIAMTGHGEVSVAVQALKAGAIEFIEKPFPGLMLIDAVLSALKSVGEPQRRNTETAEIARRVASLTQREREVMKELTAGKRNEEIALGLGIEPRAVEVDRARVMEKMRAANLSSLVRMALTVGMV